MFKQAGKLNAENKDKDEPRQPNIGGQKKFPPEVKTVNMIYTNSHAEEEAPARTPRCIRRAAHHPQVQPLVGLSDHF